MKEYQQSLMKAFGERFYKFVEISRGNYMLMLNSNEFTSIDYNNITQIGWNYHIGFVKVEFFESHLSIELRAY